MFLTVLNATSNDLLRASNPLMVSNAYAVHQWLTQQQDTTRVDSGLLYHVEILQDSVNMYIQSIVPFNVSNVPSTGFKVHQENKPITAKCTEGERICFQVRALPQKCAQRKRYSLYNTDEQIKWFKHKCANHGLQVDACEVCSKEPIYFTKKGKHVTENACIYAGVATVRDADAFNTMLQKGFGHGKAFGAGLFMTSATL